MPRFFVLLLAFLTAVGPAAAHGIAVFAAPEGEVVAGYVYYPDGERIGGATVHLLGPDGVELGEMETGADGSFSFKPEILADLTIRARTADGHGAEYHIHAEDLAAAGGHEGHLEDMVEHAVARQVRPLREQIEAYEHKIRVHDVLGGIGYILGIAGILFFVRARRPASGTD